jgi:hypothetical protein
MGKHADHHSAKTVRVFEATAYVATFRRAFAGQLEPAAERSYDRMRPKKRKFEYKEVSVMKKILTIAFALSMVLGVSALILIPTAAAVRGWAALPQGAPLKIIQGTVKVDGEKVMLVADEDSKSWEVTNPDTLKPHAGHHVEVSAHVNPEKSQMHVMSVKMVKKGDG